MDTPPGSGYIPSGTRILRADNGVETSVDDLAVCSEPVMLWTLDDRLRLAATSLRSVVPAGRSNVVEVRFASGRVVSATAQTQFFAIDGWKPLSEIEISDRLAAPRRISQPSGTRSMADDELVLLAHMIGDGSCIKRQPVRYASIDEQNLAAVTNAAKYFGVTAVRDEYAAARVSTLRLPAPYRLTRGKRNPIAAWLDEMGLFDKRSHEKFVPAPVFAVPYRQVCLFLRHLWATDGCVKWGQKDGLAHIYYASTSRELVDGVGQLLLRVGVTARVYRVPQGRHRDSWHLAIQGASNQTEFLRSVDMHGAKFFDAREVLFNLEGVQGNVNVDTVPREVWTLVRKTLSEKPMTHRAFAAAMQTKFCGSTMWKHSPSRGRLHRAARVLGDRQLHDLATNHVFWDRVVEIKSVGEREVFQLAVSGADSVVAQGVSVAVTRRSGDESAVQTDENQHRMPLPLHTNFIYRDSW